MSKIKEKFEILANEILQYPRMQGYYLLKFVELSDLAIPSNPQDLFLDSLFQILDDQSPYPPYEERTHLGLWEDYVVDPVLGLDQLATALQGGGNVGHGIDTISPNLAKSFCERFDNLFMTDKRYYTGLGFGNLAAYVFSSGLVGIDSKHAGMIYVIESD